jgi:hypothetical protein
MSVQYTGLSAAERFLQDIATGLLGEVDPKTTARERFPREVPAFIRTALGFDMWPIQEEIAQAIEDHSSIAVRSCHAAGKSAISARICLAFLHTRPNSIVVTTAPTARQVQNILWRYINTSARRSSIPLMGRALQTRYEIESDWYALGFKGSDDNSDAFQGFHAEDILVIADESAGVSESVFEGMDSILTGAGAKQLLIGNPTSVSGTFRRAFHEARAVYHGIKISAYDTPNFTTFGITREDMLSGEWKQKIAGKTLPYPALIDPRWVAKQIITHGAESPYVRSRVDAEFPEDDGTTLIPLSWIERAENNVGTLHQEDAERFVGIDAARFGDDETSVLLRHGMESGPHDSWNGLDTMESVGRVVAFLDKYGYTKENTTEVRVDDVGVGAGIADRMKELGWKVRRVNVGGKSSDKEKWPNLRHELWWQLRMRYQEDRIAPMAAGRWNAWQGKFDDEMKGQLSDIKFRYDSNHTRPLIERKEEAKKRGVKSPDRAEAQMLAFGNYPRGEGVPGVMAFGTTKSRR